MTITLTSNTYYSPARQRKYSLLKDLPEDFFHETARLRRLGKYVINGKNVVHRGRLFDDTCCLLFWPDLQAADTLARLRGYVYSPERMAQDDAQLARDFSGDQHEERMRARLRFLKLETEHLLGPLLLPSDCSQTDALISSFAAMHGAVHRHDPMGELLLDPTNYTVFRRVTFDEVSLMRTRIPLVELPPVATALKDVPDVLVLLYTAWKTLYQRQQEPFDSQDVGLDWARNGYVFVNWERFRRSRFWPRTIAIEAHKIDDAIMKLPTFCNVNRALLKRDLDSTRVPPPNTSRLDYEVRSLSLYLELCIKTEAFNYTPGDVDPATLFDPLVLRGKPNIFDGRWHWRRKERARVRQAEIRQAKKDGVTLPSARGTKVYRLVFKPLDYLKDLPPEFPLWFPRDHEDIVYAIRRKRELCFTNPPALGQATPAEHELWKRVMDSVKLVETIYETDKGTVVDIRKQCRSKFFSQAKDEHLERFIQIAAQEALSFNKNTTAIVAAAKTKAAREFQQRTGMPTEMWYHHGVLPDAVAKIVNEDTYRRIANVVLPDQPEKGEQARHFFTPEMITVMDKFARAATLQQMKPYNPDLEVVMTNAVGPTPYILAWARFCHLMNTTDMKTLHQPGKVHGRRRWSPADDVVLLARYRKYPTLSPKEWKALLAEFPERDKASCRNRVAAIRKMVERGVAKSTAERLRIGFKASDAETAYRLVFLYGYIAEKRTSPDFRKALPSAGRILSLDFSFIQRWPLPDTYGNGRFTSIVEGRGV